MSRGILDEEWTNEPYIEDDKIKKARYKIEKEIDKVNEDLIKCYKGITEGCVGTYRTQSVMLEGKKEGLKLALSKVK